MKQMKLSKKSKINSPMNQVVLSVQLMRKFNLLTTIWQTFKKTTKTGQQSEIYTIQYKY